MKINLLIIVLLSGCLLWAFDKKPAAAAVEQSEKITEIVTVPTEGSVEFEAIGRPNMLVIKGLGEGVTSSIKINNSKLSGEINFKLESLKTGIDSRDQDMKEKYLQISQFPVAKIKFEEFQMPAGWNIKNSKVVTSSFRGKLILHGIEKEITGLYTIAPDFAKASAKFDVKLSDYKIMTPVYLGIKVADFVKVTVIINKVTIVK